MDHVRRSTAAGFVALLALLFLVAPSRASVQYCSSQNTAETDVKLWDWQSNGWCTDQCKQDYAFAVVLYKSCYCSNVVPSDQRDTSDCNDDCPGFPDEKCGNQEENLYAYIKMSGHDPTATQGSSSSTSADASPSPSANPPSTTEAAPSKTEATTTQKPTTAPTAPTASTTSAAPEETEPEQTTTAKPQTSLVVVTKSGQVVTQTVITTPTASSAPMQVPSQKGSSTGTIVGGVVGGVAGVAAVAGGIFFLLWRRRRQQQQQGADDDEGQSGVHRNTSTMSKAGLIRGEKMPQQPTPIATSFNNTRRSSRMMDNESISPISASDRRNSRHLVDQRLNPSAIFVLDNSSRGSFASMEDSRDYHRPLNIRNPDVQ